MPSLEHLQNPDGISGPVARRVGRFGGHICAGTAGTAMEAGYRRFISRRFDSHRRFGICTGTADTAMAAGHRQFTTSSSEHIGGYRRCH